MIVYHTLFDVIYFFNINIDYSAYLVVSGIRDFGAALFIFLSGFSFILGHHHLRHVLVLSGIGLAISVGSYFIVPDLFILFGIFTFLGVACALMCLLNKPFSKLPPIPFAIVNALLFLVFLSVNYGYIGFGEAKEYAPLVIAEFPQELYRNTITAFFGFPDASFSSGDYFSLLPWIFAYFSGFFTARAVIGKPRFEKVAYIDIPFIRKTGKLSMYIYLIHQPLIYGIVMLLKTAVG